MSYGICLSLSDTSLSMIISSCICGVSYCCFVLLSLVLVASCQHCSALHLQWSVLGYLVYPSECCTQETKADSQGAKRKGVGWQGHWLVLCPFRKVTVKKSACLLGQRRGPANLTTLSRCFVTTRGRGFWCGFSRLRTYNENIEFK